ncbi:MAG: DUF4838 domain-containing protein [Kiritimatiellae bacterium]|nr:DUF4838 domain-containing protein [Kiritimatiellia bacterium]
MSSPNAIHMLPSCAAGLFGAVVLLASGCRSLTSAGGESPLCLTSDGQPTASIVISTNPTRSAIVAAIELRDHVKKISGAELPIVADTAEVKGTRVLVGESAATRALGLRNADFKSQEYMIGVRGGNLVLMGYDGDLPYGSEKDAGATHPALPDFAQLKLDPELIKRIVWAFDDEHATCFAVYDFLERDCGVRWYAPTELGMVYTKRSTLTVRVKELRRAPAFACRFCRRAEVTGEKENWGAYSEMENVTAYDASLWSLRMKFGGKQTVANHGLYSYYDRFWEKNPKNPGAFEGEHPEYFAKGYKGIPPQLCYSHPAVVAQVAKDAVMTFKTGKNPGVLAGKDWFSVEPMDNDSFCKCEDCRKWFPDVELGKQSATDVFMCGRFSDYIFQFANAVQKEVSKTCPDIHAFVLAYASHGFPPQFPLDPRIYIGPNLAIRQWLSPGDPKAFAAWIARESKDPKSEVYGYKMWVAEKKTSGRLLSMWLHTGFPLLYGTMHGFHVFHGYDAHTLANQMKMLAADGIKGAFCGGDQLECYLLLEYMDNPTQDIDVLLNEFFTRYYGAAGEPLKRIYQLIEATYTDRSNYPSSFQIPGHQTEEIAWRYLGTQERMDKMARWMDEARAARLSEVERRRVDLFDKGPWQYMVEGRRQWVFKSQHTGEVERLKALPPPSAQAPVVPDAAGDLTKVDWSRAGRLAVAHTHEGYPAERQIAVEIAHDASHLYLRLSDPVARDKVKAKGTIFWDDRWEIFLAAQCGAAEYVQIGIKPDGRFASNAYPGCKGFDSGAKVRCRVDDQGWTTELAAPLSLVWPAPRTPGERLYLNLYRPASAGQTTLAWSPNFAGSGFNTTARLGVVTLAP